MNPAKGAAVAPPARTVILGSSGRMGAMFMRKADGILPVKGEDLPYNRLDELCAGAELALFCVPAKYFESVLARVIPHLPPTAILADITSVKEAPMRQMKKYWSGQIVGTHPLFGPKNSPGDDLPVVLVADNNTSRESMEKVAAFFQALGCRTFESSARQHDEAMAKIQNMNFITNLAYFAALAGQKDLLPFLTPSFARRKNAAEKMLTEDAEMFAGLFEANAHSHEAVRQYRKMLNVAASGDIELLCKRAQWWWDLEHGPESD